MKHFLIAFCTSLILSCAALAQGVATFSYQNGQLVIRRANPPPLPLLPWAPADQPLQFADTDLMLNVDIRGSSALYQQEGWIDLSGLSLNQGMLFIFDQPSNAYVPGIQHYKPLDVVWINAEGRITQIAPNLLLAELQEPLTSKGKSKALLLLSGGACEQLSIYPNDRLLNENYFTPPPKILTAPQ